MRSLYSSAIFTGSPPPASTWPVSRQSGTADSASALSICSGDSTTVPKWGWSDAARPCLAADLGRLLQRNAKMAPIVVVQLLRCLVGIVTTRGGEYGGIGTGFGHRDDDCLQSGDLFLPAIGAMQDDGHEPADQSESVAAEYLLQGRGIGREETRWSQLGGPHSDRRHLGQHPVGLHPVTPSRHLADAPRYGGAGDAIEEIGHVWVSTGVLALPVMRPPRSVPGGGRRETYRRPRPHGAPRGRPPACTGSAAAPRPPRETQQFSA